MRETGPFVGGIRADGGWFGPGDDLERAWDEAEAILLATEELDAVMQVIRESESPVEARRALKLSFGFTGRQAALLLTLPVMSFTRSERRRLDEGRRARMDLLADVTGVLPVVPGADDATHDVARPAARPIAHPATHDAGGDIGGDVAGDVGGDTAYATDWSTDFGATFDGVLAGISSAMTESEVEAPPLLTAPPAPDPEPFVFSEQSPSGSSRPPVVPAPASDVAPNVVVPAPAPAPSGRPTRSVRRSLTAQEEASAVLDEQIGELCDAMAMVVGVTPAADAWSDDPRSSSDSSGGVLDRCGVDDRAGIRTLLWHLRRTGLDGVEGLFPFAEPLSAHRGVVAQSALFESAMAEGRVGSQPGADVHWATGLWPIAERRGFGYAVVFGDGPEAGSVWAYGGGEPLHRLWDSVVDLLVELYQSVTIGAACDAAVGAVLDGRVVWTNLS